MQGSKTKCQTNSIWFWDWLKCISASSSNILIVIDCVFIYFNRQMDMANSSLTINCFTIKIIQITKQ